VGLVDPDGMGMLLGGRERWSGKPGDVLVIGGGTAGLSAAYTAHALGACVFVVDRDPAGVAQRIDEDYQHILMDYLPTRENMSSDIPHLCAIINAVHWDPSTGRTLITREDLKTMIDGSVIIDIDCTPGGAIETAQRRTIDDPMFVEEGVIHHCASNLPAMVPRTSTYEYGSALLPYVKLLADHGLDAALTEKPELAHGLIARDGELLDAHIAEVQER